MSKTVSVRELLNNISKILRDVETGERVTVMVDRHPVAQIVPLERRRNVSFTEATQMAHRHPADRKLLDELRTWVHDTTDDL